MSGMKVRVTIRFRGREITYPEIALEDLREIAEDLNDIATIEQAPDMEGRTMGMLLASNMKKIAKLKEERANSADEPSEIEEPFEDEIDDDEEEDED